jgi:hypothetical protein
LTLIASIVLSVSSYSGCSKKPPQDKKAESKNKTPSAHTISKKTEKELIKDAYEDIEILTKITINTSELKKILSGKALKNMTNSINNDLTEGKIKKRSYGSVKIYFKNYTKGIAGLTLKFVDKSYYIDKNTQQQISQPTNLPQKFALSLKKVDKRWKIDGIYSPNAKEPVESEIQ